MEKAILRCRKLLLALVIMIAVAALRRRRQPIASRRSLCGLTVTSWSRTVAALLRRQFLGIGVARCRRPGQFDERHDPPTGAVKLANDEALLLDVGQQTPCTAQRMRAISARNRCIARAGPTFLRGAGDHHEDALHILRQK